MMRAFFSALAIIFLACSIQAQGNPNPTFSFRSKTSDPDYNKPYDLMSMGKHALGEDIARKLYFVKNTYTYREEPSPTSPTPKTIVRKPRIYNNLKKILTFYTKEAKSGNLTREEAIAKASYCLDVAYSIFYENTDEFENLLKTLKAPNELADAFQKVELR